MLQQADIRKKSCKAAFTGCLALLVLAITLISAFMFPQGAYADDHSHPPADYRAWQRQGWGAAGNYDLSWYDGGQGTYTIRTPQELAGLAHLVNFDGVTFAGSRIYLENDIDLGGLQWTPIGTNYGPEAVFRGEFNGNSHSIINMNINYDVDYLALFGRVGGAVIRNLKVYGDVVGQSTCAGVVAVSDSSSFYDIANYANVTTTGVRPRSSSETYMGGAAGVVCYVQTTNSSANDKFIRLLNFGNINSGGDMGAGIIGFILAGSEGNPGNATISRCANYGDVSVGAHSSQGENSVLTKGVGGILGASASMGKYVIEQCANTGNISSVSDPFTGGIAGNLRGDDSQVNYAYNTGSVQGALHAGGILGSMGAGVSQVAGCYNSGTIAGSGSLGAIIGRSVSDFNFDERVFNNAYLDASALQAAGNGMNVALEATMQQFRDGTVESLLNSYDNIYKQGEKSSQPLVFGWMANAVPGGTRGQEGGSPQGGGTAVTIPGESGPGTAGGDAGGGSGGLTNSDGGAQDSTQTGPDAATGDDAIQRDSTEGDAGDENGQEGGLQLVELDQMETETETMPPVPSTPQWSLLALCFGLLLFFGIVRELSSFMFARGPQRFSQKGMGLA